MGSLARNTSTLNLGSTVNEYRRRLAVNAFAPSILAEDLAVGDVIWARRPNEADLSELRILAIEPIFAGRTIRLTLDGFTLEPSAAMSVGVVSYAPHHLYAVAIEVCHGDYRATFHGTGPTLETALADAARQSTYADGILPEHHGPYAAARSTVYAELLDALATFRPFRKFGWCTFTNASHHAPRPLATAGV